MSRLIKTASIFVDAIVNGEHALAHEMLLPDLAEEISAAKLAEEFEMISSDMGGVRNVGEAMIVLEDWPSKTPNDLAIVYFPLEGDVYTEAITVTLSELDNQILISNIEWGRP